MDKSIFEEKMILCERRNFKKNETFEMHHHNYIEMEVILKGCAEHIYNGDVTKVGRGDCYIITPHDFHAFQAKSDIELLNLRFDLNILDEEIVNALSLISFKNFYCGFAENELKTICRNIENINFEQENKLPLSNTISKAYIQEIVINIIRASKSGRTLSPSLAQKMISYIHTNFRNGLSLNDISTHFLCTPNYAGRIIANHTGVSFNCYLNRLRLKYVCSMLEFSNHTINDIAIMAGYSSIEYFFFVFKKFIGTTPLNYRRNHRKA